MYIVRQEDSKLYDLEYHYVIREWQNGGHILWSDLANKNPKLWVKNNFGFFNGKDFW